jgi:enolase-phosphatase E1
MLKAILCDIEGTTTSISFVKDVLFKIASDECHNFLNANFDDPEIQKIIAELLKESGNENCEDSKEKKVQVTTDYVQQLIKADKKVKSLKLLQGKIWKNAYEKGLVKGHVYDDVLSNFKRWTEKGYKIFIYSSGSVEAQKLIFSYSTHGNLCEYLSGYFDTNVGHKQEEASYQNILNEIGLKGEEVLFLSDIPAELDAAFSVSISCILLDRPNNPTKITNEIKQKFKVAKDFDEIEI